MKRVIITRISNKSMKTNIIKTIMVLILVGVIAIPAFVGAQVPSSEGDNTGGADSAPATEGGNTGGADSALTTDGGNTGGADSNGNESSGSFVPATEGGNTGGADTGVSAEPTNNNSGSNGGGSSGGSRSRRTVTAVTTTTSTTLPTITNIGNCSYLNSYMKIGGKNNSTEVIKLQTFLKNVEGHNVDINGMFDQKTLDAVKAFQTKYVNDVMRPWGVKSPTGQVWYTTQKKINEIFCKTNFTLTASQLAQIEAYKANRSNVIVSTPINNVDNGSTTTPENEEVGSATTSDQTASVEGTSFGSRVWQFIKWLFGY